MDSSPQAYAEHLERVHALHVQNALQRAFGGDDTHYVIDSMEVENVIFSQAGDAWVETYALEEPETLPEPPVVDENENEETEQVGELDPIVYN